MMCFDMLSLETKMEYFDLRKEATVKCKEARLNSVGFMQMLDSEGKLQELVFCQKAPYLLKLNMNVQTGRVFIRFSGKILLKDYKKLINKETIRQCFENINELGLCWMDIDKVLNDSVVQCVHVTEDIACKDYSQVKEVIENTKESLSSYRKWKWTKYENGGKDGMVIEKNVSSKQCKERLAVYDKYQELCLSKNDLFHNFVGDEVIKDFENMVRVELQLESKMQIIKRLQIGSNDLRSVLESNADPIKSFLERSISLLEIENGGGKEGFERYLYGLFFKDCGGDYELMENRLRLFYPNDKSHVKTRRLEPIKRMLMSDRVEVKNVRWLYESC